MLRLLSLLTCLLSFSSASTRAQESDALRLRSRGSRELRHSLTVEYEAAPILTEEAPILSECGVTEINAAIVAKYHNKALAAVVEQTGLKDLSTSAQSFESMINIITRTLVEDPNFRYKIPKDILSLVYKFFIKQRDGSIVWDESVERNLAETSPVFKAIADIKEKAIIGIEQDAIQDVLPDSVEEMIAIVQDAAETDLDVVLADVFAQVFRASDEFWTSLEAEGVRRLAFWKKFLSKLADAVGGALGAAAAGGVTGTVIGIIVGAAASALVEEVLD